MNVTKTILTRPHSSLAGFRENGRESRKKGRESVFIQHPMKKPVVVPVFSSSDILWRLRLS